MLIRADARALPLVDGCVDCVVTSPPYFGLRDYGNPQQIGLEPDPDAYVATLRDVFREVWRVLKPAGTVWANLGDSYAGSNASQGGDGTTGGLRRDGRSESTRIAGHVKLQTRLLAQQTQMKRGDGPRTRQRGIRFEVA